MTGRLVFANRDGAGWRTQQKRREQDIAFLTRLRELVEANDEPRLGRLAMDMVEGPQWKRIAVNRGLATVKAALAAAEGEP